MIALADWIESKPKMHHEPESLIVFAAIVLIGLACHVAACWRGRR